MEQLKMSFKEARDFLGTKEIFTLSELSKAFGDGVESQIIGYYNGVFNLNLFLYVKEGIALFPAYKIGGDWRMYPKDSRMFDFSDINDLKEVVSVCNFEMENTKSDSVYTKYHTRKEIVAFILEKQKLRRIFL